jgi:hypothetical protein
VCAPQGYKLHSLIPFACLAESPEKTEWTATTQIRLPSRDGKFLLAIEDALTRIWCEK